MLAPLNSTMIAVTLPQVMHEFDAGPATASWLVTSYLITMAALQPVTGKLGDRLGRRQLVLGGLACFGAASLAATAAPDLPALLLCRVLQAVGGAIALPNGTALVREVVPAARRASAFGLVGAAVAVAAAAGPPLGGLLAGFGGWRAIFFANVPLVVPALVVGWRILPTGARHPALSGWDRHPISRVGSARDEVRVQGRQPSPAAARAHAVPRRAPGSPIGRGTEHARSPGSRVTPYAERLPFDLAGALLLAAILIAGALLLAQGHRALSATALAWGSSLFGGAVAFFVWFELRQPDPVLQPRFFRHRGFTAANSALALSNLAMYGTLLVVPILLSSRAGWTSAQTGLVLAALSVGTVVCAPLGGRLADRLGRQRPTVAGLALLAAGLLPLAVSGGALPPAGLLGALGLAGVGLGLSQAGLQTAAVEAVERGATGVAAGVSSTSRYAGSIVASSALAALLGSASARSASAGTSGGEGLPWFLGVLVAAAGLSALAGLGLSASGGPRGAGTESKALVPDAA
jgi:MFS family permease